MRRLAGSLKIQRRVADKHAVDMSRSNETQGIKADDEHDLLDSCARWRIYTGSHDVVRRCIFKYPIRIAVIERANKKPSHYALSL